MQTLPLGVSSLTSSRLAYGCWRVAGTWEPREVTAESRAAGQRAIIVAYVSGYTLFDNADIYCGGEAERILGSVLKEVSGMRQRVIVATKGGIRPAGTPAGAPGRYDFSAQYLVDGKGAMHIMGDWTDGWFISKKYTGYGWAPVPGNSGIFDGLSDSFAAAKGAKNQDNLMNWLKLAGSKAGQEAFNPKKGSICARTDCDPKLFDDYLQSAAKDWASNAIVPSVVHGAAAFEKWSVAYQDVLSSFATKGDVAAAQKSLQQLCVDNGFCK